MDNILVKIVTMEKDARAVVADAEKKRGRLNDDVAAELDKYRESVFAAAHKTLEAAERDEQTAMRSKLAALAEKTERSGKLMRDNLKNRGDEWATRLVDDIINAPL